MKESMHVRSADRALAIFETFADARRQLQLTEIAARCYMPVSTCHALVQTLLKRGYLYSVGGRKQLYPSRRLLTLAQTINSNDPYLARMSNALELLRNRSGETVIVVKRQENSVLFLHVLESQRAIRYTANAGDFRPLHATAGGKALLSAFGEEELRDRLNSQPLSRLTSNTITEPGQLLRDLKLGRERGYFTSHGEMFSDVTGVAVPVSMDVETFALVLIGPSERMESKCREHAAFLLETKAELEKGNVEKGSKARG